MLHTVWSGLKRKKASNEMGGIISHKNCSDLNLAKKMRQTQPKLNLSDLLAGKLKLNLDYTEHDCPDEDP